MPPSSSSSAARSATAGAPRLRLVAPRRLRIADVTLFYGERSGGIRTYLDEKAGYAATTGLFEHHIVVPGRHERHLLDGPCGRHELRSLRFRVSNGYRVPLGAGALRGTLRSVRPDVVLLHDPFWRPTEVCRLARELQTPVVAVHHGSSALDAAGLPGPGRLWQPLFRAWVRHAYAEADAIMAACDPWEDARRPATIPLRFGLHAAFAPPPGDHRGDHVLYAGRLAREKGVFELLEAAARSRDPWPLRLVGSGPAAGAVRTRARRLGIERRVSVLPFEPSRERLARLYTGARCVVMPGAHETFGLVALEAAASGAAVVACSSAPSAGLLGALAHRFEPGDVGGLERAIARARRARPQRAAAAALGARHTWPRAFAAELADLRTLVGP